MDGMDALKPHLDKAFPKADADREVFREELDVQDVEEYLQETSVVRKESTDPSGKGKKFVYYQCQFKIGGELYRFNAVNMKLEDIPKAMQIMRTASARITDDVKRREFFNASFQFQFTDISGEEREQTTLHRSDFQTNKWMMVSIGQGEYGNLTLKELSDKDAKYLGMSADVPVEMDLSGKGVLKGPYLWNWARHRLALWLHTQFGGKVPEFEFPGLGPIPKFKAVVKIDTYAKRAEREAEMLKKLVALKKDDLLERIAQAQWDAANA